MQPHDTTNDPGLQGSNSEKVNTSFERAPDGRLICPYCRSLFEDGLRLFDHLAAAHPGQVYREHGVWLPDRGSRREEMRGRLAHEARREAGTLGTCAISRREGENLGEEYREQVSKALAFDAPPPWSESLPADNLSPFMRFRKRILPTLVKVSIYAGVTEVKMPGHVSPPPNAGQAGLKRGKVYGMSQRSVNRFKTKMKKIKYWKRTLFTTQTTHDLIDVETHKAAGEVFYKRLKRKFEGAAEAWKNEFQKRGAPHFHSFIFWVRPPNDDHLPYHERAVWRDFVCDETFVRQAEQYIDVLRQQVKAGRNMGKRFMLVCNWRHDWLHAFRIWYAWNWWDVLGRQSDLHLIYGTRVEEIDDRDKASAYLTKKYIGKVERNRENLLSFSSDAAVLLAFDLLENFPLLPVYAGLLTWDALYNCLRDAILKPWGILHTGRTWGVRGFPSGYWEPLEKLYLLPHHVKHLRRQLAQWGRAKAGAKGSRKCKEALGRCVYTYTQGLKSWNGGFTLWDVGRPSILGPPSMIERMVYHVWELDDIVHRDGQRIDVYTGQVYA